MMRGATIATGAGSIAADGGYPDNNPKTAMGARKVPLHLVPPSAKHFLALALRDGATKYGPYNWRDAAISVSVYKSAAERHLDAFWDGEDLASDSGVHHIAHAMACMALILDAMTIGKLHDDRPTRGAASQLQSVFASVAQPETPAAVLAHEAGHTADGAGIIPADLAAAMLRDGVIEFSPEEPPLRACPAGGCGED